MLTGFREYQHASRDALADACAWRLGEINEAALRLRGHATFALAGGSTPLPAYRRWANSGTLDTRTVIVPTDERWLPVTHPASNLGQLRRCLGDTGATCLPLAPEHASGVPDLHTAARSLQQMTGDFDGVLLGMGEDGHFASLFPGASGLQAALRSDDGDDAAIIQPTPLPANAPYPRISLTLSRLLRSGCIVLAITGSDKRERLSRVRDNPDPVRWPIAALLSAAGGRLEIHWSL